MVNHFRTLLLNRPAETPGSRFSHHVPRAFRRIHGGPVHSALDSILFSLATTRERRDLAATLVFRLMAEHDAVWWIMETVDPRVSFDPRIPPVASLDDVPRVLPAIDGLAADLAIPGIQGLADESGRRREEVSALLAEARGTRRADRRIALVACAMCLSLDSRT